MCKPDISHDFTVEDIRKLRDYFYEQHKDMDFDRMAADIERGAERGRKRIEQLRCERLCGQ